MKIPARNRLMFSEDGTLPVGDQPASLLTHPDLAEDAALLAELLPGNDGLWRESVLLWMEWHEAQQRLTGAMFASRHDAARQAALLQEMDQLDQLRWRAVELSQELLSQAGR